MSNTMKNNFGRFLQELFSRGVYKTHTHKNGRLIIHPIHTCMHILYMAHIYDTNIVYT